MVCVEDQRKVVPEKRKFVERPLNVLEEETSKLADRVTAALVIYEEHMSDCCAKLKLISNDTKRICHITGAKWMHPCNVFAMEIDSSKEDEVWDWWKSTDGEADTKRRQIKTTDETWPKLDKSSCSKNLWCSQGGARTCRSATDSVHCRLW